MDDMTPETVLLVHRVFSFALRAANAHLGDPNKPVEALGAHKVLHEVADGEITLLNTEGMDADDVPSLIERDRETAQLIVKVHEAILRRYKP